MSSTGHSHLLVMHISDTNNTHVKLMKNRSATPRQAAFCRGYEYFKKNGVKPIIERLDNEAPKVVLKFSSDKFHVTYQLLPPGMHHVSEADRAIWIFKDHFIAIPYTDHSGDINRT